MEFIYELNFKDIINLIVIFIFTYCIISNLIGFFANDLIELQKTALERNIDWSIIYENEILNDGILLIDIKENVAEIVNKTNENNIEIKHCLDIIKKIPAVFIAIGKCKKFRSTKCDLKYFVFKQGFLVLEIKNEVIYVPKYINIIDDIKEFNFHRTFNIRLFTAIKTWTEKIINFM